MLILRIAFIALIWVSCSHFGVNPEDPEALFNEAQSSIESGQYTIALDQLRSIRHRFPHSKFSIEAQLLSAEVYFKQESYLEAAAAYEGFIDLHPQHPKRSHCSYSIAKSYALQAPTQTQRDLTDAEKAIEHYRNFLSRFPESPESNSARLDLEELRSRLAKKELEIAHFYAHRNKTDASKRRLGKILNQYPDSSAAGQALEELEAHGQ